jgi:fibronectin type 3 domain-containing protein
MRKPYPAVKFALQLLLLLAGAVSSFAQTKPFLHQLFSNNMVLQRNATDPVWGWTTPGTTVTVTINSQTKTATADAAGRWQVGVGPFAAGGPYTLSVTGPQSKTLTNVMIGDVFLCSGQSNMAFNLGNVTNSAAEIVDSVNYPNIRCFNVPNVNFLTPQENLKGGSWNAAGTTATSGMTAVGYFMAREMFKHDNTVPIGLVAAPWSGSTLESWLARPLADSIADFTQTLYDQDSLGIGFDGNFMGNANPVTGHHNGMIAAIAPFQFRAAAWYQGESNAGRGEQYQRMLPLMMSNWRSLFGANLPFVIVQLVTQSGTGAGFADIREAQEKVVAADAARCRLVTALDLGTADWNLHPPDKQDVGLRASWAMRNLIYGESIAHKPPTFTGATLNPTSITCTFSDVGSGLMAGAKDVSTPMSAVQEVSGGATLTGFTIAGSNRVFQAATATITGTNTVSVSAAGLSSPQYVRYAWTDKAGGNLYAKIVDASGNTNGLPAGSFRNDPTWKLSANFASGGVTDYSAGLSHVVAATVPAGMTFHHWSGDISSTANPVSVTVSQRYVAVRAHFQINTTPVFSVTAEPGRNVVGWVPFNATGIHYTVKRGTSAGGPFTAIAQDLVGEIRYEDKDLTNGVNYYYSVVGVNEIGEGPIGTPKAAATVSVVRGVQAATSSSAVAISWQSVAGASYQIARSTVSGGSYESIATGVSGLSYTDRSVVAGKTYYYVVTATVAGTTTAASAEVAATPGFLPSPLQDSRDIGTVGFAGGASVSGVNQLTVQGSGQDISAGATDNFRFAYTALSGDCTITARVASITAGDANSKAGVMLRAGLDIGSPYALALRWGNQTGTAGLFRLAQDSTAYTLNGGGGNFWVRVTRVGNVFTNYSSPDGTTWTVLGSPQTIVMPSTIYAGFAVCSHNNANLVTGVFDDISINGGALQGPQAPQAVAADIRAADGNVLLRWNAAATANGYNIKRSTSSGGPFTTVATVADATQYAPVGLVGGTNYYFTVSSVTSAGESLNSTVVMVAVPAVTGATPVPVAVAAEPRNGQVALKWSGSSLAANFTVKRATIINGTYTTVGTFTTSSCLDTGLTNGASYYYTVTASGPAGASVASAPVAVVPRPASRFGALIANINGRYLSAAGVGAIVPGATSISASESFEFLDLGAGLTALRSSANGNYVSVLAADAKLYATATSIGTAEQFTTPLLASGDIALRSQLNNFHVTAANNVTQAVVANSGGASFAQSFQFVGLPALKKPDGLQASPADGQVSLRWNVIPGVTGYTIQRSTTVNGTYAPVATVSGTAYTDTGLAGGTTYFYVISSSSGALSDPVAATPQAADGPLNRAGWIFSASLSPTTALNAADGSMTTRWTSGTSQANGQWFQVDLGATQTFGKIVLDAGTSTNDYARGYQVFVSNDGLNWGGAVATGTGSSAVTTINFPQQTARYVRVVQTGSAGNFWSIHEFQVYGVVTPTAYLDRTGWSYSASVSSGATPPSNAGDGNSATRWSSGVAQANGQWFQIDLGTATGVGQLVLDPGALTAESPVGYQVKVSADGINWGFAIATGAGAAGPVTINLPPQIVRYVRIIQTGTSANFWSIDEIKAVGAEKQALNRTGWLATASASGSGTPAANVLDGSTSTRWSPGVAQAAGQWFQIDMGTIRSFSEIVMDAAASTNDFPRGYEIYISNDGLNWGSAVAAGSPFSTIVTIPLPRQTARYLRVMLTAAVGNLWTIYEFNAYDTPALPPASPLALTSSGGDSQITLGWAETTGATTYNIKRASSSGGPYTTIATNVLGTSFTDTGLSNGIGYYYVISATNNSGTSADSGQSAAVTAPLPSPWQRADIGSVGVAGNAYYVNPAYTVLGSGSDISGGADAFRYVSQTSSGDCSIIARVTSQQNTDAWAKAGIMIRESTAAGSINAGIFVTNGATNFQWRSSTGAATSTTGGGYLSFPNIWLKLTRTGNSIGAFKSPDGVTWTQIGTTQTITMAASATVGLAVTSHNNTVTSAATFDNVIATP